MAEAFRGEFYQKVDGKARVSIPAAFRAILNADDPQKGEKGGARLYMVYGGRARNFVECYSKRGADQLAEDIEAMDMGSPERIRAERDLISRSVMVEIDGDGRIVLPPRVREKLGLAGDLPAEAEAAFAGFTNRFRLYQREVYEAELAEADDDDVDPLTLVGRHKRAG
jgi:MraZ protein